MYNIYVILFLFLLNAMLWFFQWNQLNLRKSILSQCIPVLYINHNCFKRKRSKMSRIEISVHKYFHFARKMQIVSCWFEDNCELHAGSVLKWPFVSLILTTGTIITVLSISTNAPILYICATHSSFASF